MVDVPFDGVVDTPTPLKPFSVHGRRQMDRDLAWALSIIIPACDEAANLAALVAEIEDCSPLSFRHRSRC